MQPSPGVLFSCSLLHPFTRFISVCFTTLVASQLSNNQQEKRQEGVPIAAQSLSVLDRVKEWVFSLEMLLELALLLDPQIVAVKWSRAPFISFNLFISCSHSWKNETWPVATPTILQQWLAVPMYLLHPRIPTFSLPSYSLVIWKYILLIWLLAIQYSCHPLLERAFTKISLLWNPHSFTSPSTPAIIPFLPFTQLLSLSMTWNPSTRVPSHKCYPHFSPLLLLSAL